MKNSILIIGNSSIYSILLRDFLDRNGFHVLDEVQRPWQALKIIEQQKPDIVLVRACPYTSNGLEIASILKAEHPSQRIIILSALSDPRSIIAALELSIEGYLLTTSKPEDLINDLKAIINGEITVTRRISGAVLKEWQKHIRQQKSSPKTTSPRVSLSPREIEILILVSKGKTNKEIGDQLNLSPNTVKRHVSIIIEKLGARSRAEAVRLGLPFLTDTKEIIFDNRECFPF